MRKSNQAINRRNFLSRLGTASLAAALPWETARLQGQTNETAAPAGAARGKVWLRTFDYRGVTLLRGMFRRQVEHTRDLYFNLSNDDILKGFRRQAGLPAPGNDLRGWASNTCDATFGQWLSGMARLSCALGDTAVRNKAVALVEGWKEAMGDRGRYHMGTYSWEKMACGLVDLALYANYDRELKLLEKTTNWAMRQFDRSRSPANASDRDGRRPRGTLEWYTLTENMFRAYQLTGNETFRAFGELWLYHSYWNKFENSAAPASAEFLHSYSHVNTFCGAAMAYSVTGEPRYLRILRNACDYVTNTQAYATGGYGPGEWSVPADGSLGRALEIRSDTAEIPCGSWAGFKLSRYHLGFTGEARYVDWIETLLYNGIGAALPVQPDGRTFYYADYRLGMATKLYHWDEWPCCSGTYLQTVGDYHNVLYLKDEKGVFVNLFVPSEATWQQGGQEIVLRQETKFPESDDISFRVQTAQPVNFALRIRVPSWSVSCNLKVNDTDEIPARADSAGWAKVERIWNPNDRLKLTVRSGLRVAPVDPQHPRRAAVKFGPVLLAQEARFTYPLAMAGDDLAACRT